MAIKYSKEHEWIKVENGIGKVGISDYAQGELGDIVYATLTVEVGDEVSESDSVAEIESVKSVSQIYAPVSGEVIEFNPILEDESESGIINEDPLGDGWLFKIKLTNESELDNLMSESDYLEYIKTL